MNEIKLRIERSRVINGRRFIEKTLILAFALALILASNVARASVKGDIATIAGAGPADGETATNAGVWGPEGIALDSSGSFYFSTVDNQVWKVNPSIGTLALVAGNRTAGYSGDGGAAISATLNRPTGLAIDSQDNLYIADNKNKVIRKVDATGKIARFAGNGSAGYSGDGGAATSAMLNYPMGVAIDASGNVYIADSLNNVIRKVDATGKITTFAGNGTAGYSGDGGAATSAMLNYPMGVAIDATGNVYIADGANKRIRKVDVANKISTFAGNGDVGYSGDGGAATSAGLSPAAVAVNSSGSVYIADRGNNAIRKVDASGIIATIAGNGTADYTGDGGSAASATFNSPMGITLASTGDIYIADSLNNAIRKINVSGMISTIAGIGGLRGDHYGGDGGKAISSQLSGFGIAFDSSDELYFADNYVNRIRKIDASGMISTIAGTGIRGYSGDGGAATSATLRGPYDVAFDSQGDVYIDDGGNYRIRKIDAFGNISTVAGNGTSGHSGDGGAATSAGLWSPAGIAFDSHGDLLIADGNTVRKVAPSGIISTVAGTGVSGYSGDEGFATSAMLTAEGVAVDSLDNIYIVDTANYRIRKVNAAGIITTVAGSGFDHYYGDGLATVQGLNVPTGIAIDASNNLFIACNDDNAIRMVNASGNISTVAGNGVYGFSGDGGPAISAELSYPYDLAFDSQGNLFFYDRNNDRIREVYQAGADKGAPSVSIGYGDAYVDLSGSHAALNGHPYLRVKVQDGGSGLNSGALAVTSPGNSTFAAAEESVESVLSPGVSAGSNNPVYFYYVKTALGSSSSITFSATDVAGNYGRPNLSVSSLSFVKGSPVIETEYRQVSKEQGKVSILAMNGDLRNVVAKANGESIPAGVVSAGTAKVIDLRSRLREDGENEITVTAEGDAGTEARTLASSATLESIDPSEAANRKVFARGDLDRDGRVTVTDAVKLLRIVSGLDRATPAEAMLGDIDLDGLLTVSDITRTLRTSTGL